MKRRILSRGSRPPRTHSDGVTTTTVLDVELGLVTVVVHHFAAADVDATCADVREHLAVGRLIRVDLSQMADAHVSGIWVSSLVATNRRARRAGSTLVIAGAPPSLASVLSRLRVPLADS